MIVAPASAPKLSLGPLLLLRPTRCLEHLPEHSHYTPFRSRPPRHTSRTTLAAPRSHSAPHLSTFPPWASLTPLRRPSPRARRIPRRRSTTCKSSLIGRTRRPSRRSNWQKSAPEPSASNHVITPPKPPPVDCIAISKLQAQEPWGPLASLTLARCLGPYQLHARQRGQGTETQTGCDTVGRCDRITTWGTGRGNRSVMLCDLGAVRHGH